MSAIGMSNFQLIQRIATGLKQLRFSLISRRHYSTIYVATIFFLTKTIVLLITLFEVITQLNAARIAHMLIVRSLSTNVYKNFRCFSSRRCLIIAYSGN